MKPKYKLLVYLFVILFVYSCDPEVVIEQGNNSVSADQIYKVAKMSIVTENSATVSSRESYVNCTVAVNSDAEQWNYFGTAKIRGRGNSTWYWYPKKPYRIKLDQKSELLGLKDNSDWVLLANYRDPTMLMNTFVFNIGSGLGLPYTNNTRFVELTLNGEYVGLYQLTEQIEQGNNRVKIDQTGGILLALDVDDGPENSPDATNNFWSSIYYMPISIKYPNDVTKAQLNAVKTDFALLENAIKNADYKSVDGILDIQSFIDYMIIQELVYNVEVDAPRSIFIHKNNNGKWTMGPLWDFDAGFDFDWSTMYTGHNYFASYKELVLGTDPVNHTKGYHVASFFTDMFKSKQFVSEYKARWLDIKDKFMSEYWVITQKYANGFNSAIAENANRWPIDKNYQTETTKMEQWLRNRIGYLSTVIANYPSGSK